MRLGYTSEDFARVLDDIAHAIQTLPAEERALRARHQLYRDDGVRAQNYEVRGGPANVIHDFGTPGHPELQTVPQVADPTGELVANADNRPDPLGAALVKAWHSVHEARRHIDAAVSAIANTRPPAAPEVDEPSDDIWCASCLRIQLFNPRSRGRLCAWCYGWQCAYDKAVTEDPAHADREPRWPPTELLEKRARGIRITSRITDEALKHHQARQQGRKKKRHA